MEKRYSVIIFDLGNTLIKFDHTIAAKKLANLFRIDSQKIYDLFFSSELTHLFEKGLISPREFYKRATESLGIKMPFTDFVAIWNDIFWEDEAACALARQLKKSYKLFLLSNVNRLHYEHVAKKFDIIGIFDEVILSFMVGAVKPEEIIFENAIRRAGGDKTKVLYIDDREDLISEAKRLGIDAVRYESADSLIGELKKREVI